MGEDMSRGGDGPSSHPISQFHEYLAGLKQSGSGLLVTGEASEEARIAVSRKLFGSPTAETPRRRILITTDSGIEPEAYLPDDVSPSDDNVRVIEWGGQIRGAAATVQSPNRHTSILDHLETETDTAFSELLRTDSPVPGALRVGVTSLQPLIDVAGVTRVEEFCTLLVTKTRLWKGMVHVHYPGPASTESGSRISRHMDARIHLRSRPEQPVEWRWQTGNSEIDQSLSWMPVES